MAISRVFVDTGALFGAENPRDQHYQRSRQTWNALPDTGIRFYSSEAVFQETAMLLHHRLGPSDSIRWIELQEKSEVIIWLPIDRQVRRASTPWIKKYADQGVSFVDATSFVLMRRENIKHVFSFDRHFTAAGFRLLQD